MNKVTLIGRLTKDPELKFTPGTGTAVTTFTIAVDRRFSSKDGQKEADFIPIVVWGKLAEITANYMSKGRLLAVAGRIQTRNYEAKDGTKRYITEVVAEDVQFLDKGNGPSSINRPTQSNSDEYPQDNSFKDDIQPVDDDEIPF